MLTPNSSRKHQPQRALWTLSNVIAGISVILLFSAMGVSMYQNEEKFRKEQSLRFDVENRLKILEATHAELKKTIETNKKIVEDAQQLMSQIQASEPVLTDENGNSNTPKYYDVVGVKRNDALNIRKNAGASNEIVGTIPPNSKCIVYLNERAILDNKSVWVKISYKDTTGRELQGWVSMGFFKENKGCNDAEEHSPASEDSLPEEDSQAEEKL